MLRRQHIGLLTVSVTLLMLPACVSLEISRSGDAAPTIGPPEEWQASWRTPTANPPVDANSSAMEQGTREVDVTVNFIGPIAALQKAGSRFRESMAAKTVSRRLELPVPLSAEVAIESVEPPLALPVGLQAVVPAVPPVIELPVAQPVVPIAAVPDDSPLVEALRCYITKSPEQAAQHLNQCDKTCRDMLASLLPVAVKIADGDMSQADPHDVSAFLEQMEGILAPLRERAALEIPKLCFCRPAANPSRSAVYELLDENHLFRPGEVVALYIEVRNFTCQARGDDFQTHLITSVEIRDDHNQVVNRFDIDKVDPSLSPRQDYSHGLRFALPTLPAGSYTLWLKATDVPSGRTTKRSLDFRVTTVPARGM